MGIGDNIKLYRKKANFTQKGLAEKCGCATGTIQQYELGKREPRAEQLKRIAEVLNISVYELIGSDEKNYRTRNRKPHGREDVKTEMILFRAYYDKDASLQYFTRVVEVEDAWLESEDDAYMCAMREALRQREKGEELIKLELICR